MDRMIFVFAALLCHPCSGLQVTAPSAQVAVFRSQVLLPCSFRINAPVIDPQFLAIIWFFEDKEVVRYDNKDKEVSTGLSFNEQEARQGNASLFINSVTIANHGTFRCLVIYSPDRQQKEIKLNVHVAPKVQLSSSRTEDHNELVYICEAKGFFPEPISINWLVDGKTADLSRGTVDDVFNKQIYYQINLKEDKVPEQISCSVQHEILVNPVIKTMKVNQYNECRRNCHTGLAVLLPFVIIAFAGYLIIRTYLRGFKVSHIHQERTWANNEEMVTLYCMASSCPKVPNVTWTVKIQNQNPIEISETEKYKDEEKGPLLHKDYTMKTVKTEGKGLYNATTMLSFNPAVCEYKNTKFECKVRCDGKIKERSLECKFEHKMPQMKDSIKVFRDDSNDVVGQATLESFYPRNIQIQWSYGGDQHKDIQDTKEEITHNTNDNTYNVVCKCKIPINSLLKLNEGIRVRLKWKHPTMDQPDSRDMIFTEISRLPVMEDIDVPTLIHGQEAQLQCVIRGYFPNNLEVKWFQVEAGKMWELSSNDKYKIPVIESTKQPDETYTCTASLIVSVSAPTDHGSEFICRVTHLSLMTHLEKKTGQLSVKGIPKLQMKYGNNHLIAEISDYTPKSINVIWSRTRSKKPAKNYKPDEIKLVKEVKNDDGTFTSIRGVYVKEKEPYKEYEVTVEHETLKSPTTIKIFRKHGHYSVYENGKETELQKCEDPDVLKMMPKMGKHK
ncbi:uncharacterized protein [Pyxicephalus adspersus]|uniref:uncharacterized protein isoform X2 n=1 Tax=Pyxicephalus adspersus TaxID=30357 RepID=UPI003B58F915